MRNSLRQVGSGVVKAYILLRFEIKNLRVQLVSFIVIFFLPAKLNYLDAGAKKAFGRARMFSEDQKCQQHLGAC